MRDRRWFRGKARRIRSADVRDTIPLHVPGMTAAMVVLDVRFSDGDPETYLLPLALLTTADSVAQLADTPQAAIARIGDAEGPSAILLDGMRVPAVCEALLDVIGRRRRLRGQAGQLGGQPTRAFRTSRGPDPLPATPSRAEQSNSSVTFADRLMLKLYRRLEPGINPDFQIGEFLTEQGFGNVPAVAGQIEYRSADGEVGTAAICQAYVPNEGDVWELTLDDLGTYLERVVTAPRTPEVGSGTGAALLERAAQGLPEEVKADIGPYLDRARLLGIRTGELHRALASRGDDPTFAPEPFSTLYQRSLYQSVRTTVRQNLRLLVRQIGDLPEQARPDAQAALRLESVVDKRLDALLERRLGGMRIRCHGDLHLGQILHTGRDFVFIDFEGEPGRPLSERLLKRSPLTDVAGMLRSFQYAASGSLIRTKSSGSVRPEDTVALDVWARYWYTWTSAAFLRGYRRATDGATFLPTDDEEWAILLDVLILQKAFYELNYELNNRPDWVTIPLQGIASLLTA
jgi:maltose alpha-D-glucosyltransferase/alpha-amylase